MCLYYKEDIAAAERAARQRELEDLPDALHRFLQAEEGVSDALLQRVRGVLRTAAPRLALHMDGSIEGTEDGEQPPASPPEDSGGKYPDFDLFFTESFAIAAEVQALFRLADVYPILASQIHNILPTGVCM